MTVIDLDDLTSFRKGINDINEAHLDYIDFASLDYSSFYKNYIYGNKPCVIKAVTTNWACQSLWVKNGKPNIPFLKEMYGNAVVPVADCNEKYFNSQSKTEMKMSEYADYWLNYSPHLNMPCLYLKDWHYQRDNPCDEVYELPVYFASDWLNEYLLQKADYDDDYRFVYIGPKGSWTPFHSDVFSSFSWSVNICGKKKWVFYAPGEEKHFLDRFGKLTYSVESEDLKDEDLFPHLEGLKPPLVLIQEVGDAVFVPSGWHHQVWNIEDTISINHNWVNGCNIGLMLEDILKKLHEVEQEIKDCEDMDGWTEHCQLLLKSVYGMDVAQFCHFIFYITEVRLQALKENRPLKTNLSRYLFGRNHILHDLSCLKPVLSSLLDESLECVNNSSDKIIELLESISEIITQ